ncbi:MAG: META domain-containing protein [Synechococcaceae cyanobacterium SM2_3_1]|nr:META domain-containing protein [Synechococcaceae cyanobacterium SM2_3_1]
MQSLPQDMDAPTLSELANTDWILINLKDDQQPVLTDTEITATFTEAQMQGFGGCNAYTAPIKVEDPDNAERRQQALTLGPILSTRKACAVPILNQEQQFFGLWNQSPSGHTRRSNSFSAMKPLPEIRRPWYFSLLLQ